VHDALAVPTKGTTRAAIMTTAVSSATHLLRVFNNLFPSFRVSPQKYLAFRFKVFEVFGALRLRGLYGWGPGRP
jgi:hypothetical protein